MNLMCCLPVFYLIDLIQDFSPLILLTFGLGNFLLGIWPVVIGCLAASLSLYPRETSSIIQCDNQNLSKHCQMSPGVQNHPLARSTDFNCKFYTLILIMAVLNNIFSKFLKIKQSAVARSLLCLP